MYMRFTTRTNTDGGAVRYVTLAHNRRMDRQTKPDVLMNLGRVDRIDIEGLRRLAASINKHFGDVDLLGAGDEAGWAVGTAPLEVIAAHPVGATWLVDGGWRQLPVGAAARGGECPSVHTELEGQPRVVRGSALHPTGGRHAERDSPR
jgi:hypothetical protein